MKTQVLILAFSFALFGFICCDPSSPPVWPEQFEQSFNETFTYGPSWFSSSTSGKFYYDWTNRRYRVDRENGKWDRYCGAAYKLTSTPCSHIVVEGKRYLYYPEKNYCCFCCDAANGCGILKRDWLTNATFQGYVESNGIQQEKWDKPGLQHNYVYFTADSDRIMTQIDQQPNDVQFFDPRSFHLGISDPSVLELPQICVNAGKCSTLSTCTIA